MYQIYQAMPFSWTNLLLWLYFFLSNCVWVIGPVESLKLSRRSLKLEEKFTGRRANFSEQDSLKRGTPHSGCSPCLHSLLQQAIVSCCHCSCYADTLISSHAIFRLGSEISVDSFLFQRQNWLLVRKKVSAWPSTVHHLGCDFPPMWSHFSLSNITPWLGKSSPVLCLLSKAEMIQRCLMLFNWWIELAWLICIAIYQLLSIPLLYSQGRYTLQSKLGRRSSNDRTIIVTQSSLPFRSSINTISLHYKTFAKLRRIVMGGRAILEFGTEMPVAWRRWNVRAVKTKQSELYVPLWG